MRLRARVDKNQESIVKAMRQMGATVQPLHMVGHGVPDLLVGYRGINLLVEIKDGDKPQSARRLTVDEETWRLRWEGDDVYVVKSVDDALDLLMGMRI